MFNSATLKQVFYPASFSSF